LKQHAQHHHPSSSSSSRHHTTNQRIIIVKQQRQPSYVLIKINRRDPPTLDTNNINCVNNDIVITQLSYFIIMPSTAASMNHYILAFATAVAFASPSIVTSAQTCKPVTTVQDFDLVEYVSAPWYSKFERSATSGGEILVGNRDARS
jgi:hypothetical protein